MRLRVENIEAFKTFETLNSKPQTHCMLVKEGALQSRSMEFRVKGLGLLRNRKHPLRTPSMQALPIWKSIPNLAKEHAALY